MPWNATVALSVDKIDRLSRIVWKISNRWEALHWALLARKVIVRLALSILTGPRLFFKSISVGNASQRMSSIIRTGQASGPTNSCHVPHSLHLSYNHQSMSF